MAKINEIDITSLTFQEGSAPTTPASTKWKLYTKTDGLYVVDDAGTETGPLGTGGGGGGGTVPGWVSYLAERQTGETSTSDDDFFDDGTKTGFTETTVTGTATWTEKYGLMSVENASQTAGDAAVALHALTPSSSPVTIETSLKGGWDSSQYWFAGVCLTDGTASSSKVVGTALQYGSGVRLHRGTLTDFWNANTTLGTVTHSNFVERLYLRVVWQGANSWDAAYSYDGVTWHDGGIAAQSYTMTPTHFGLLVSSWGSATPRFTAFDYLRMNESDLSA